MARWSEWIKANQIDDSSAKPKITGRIDPPFATWSASRLPSHPTSRLISQFRRSLTNWRKVESVLVQVDSADYFKVDYEVDGDYKVDYEVQVFQNYEVFSSWSLLGSRLGWWLPSRLPRQFHQVNNGVIKLKKSTSKSTRKLLCWSRLWSWRL